MPPYIGQPYPTTRPEHHSGRLGTPDPEYHTSPDDAEHHTSPDAEHHTSPYPEYHTLFRPNQSKNSFNYALGVLARVNPPENYVGRNNLTSLLETLERNTRHYRTSPPGYHACEEYYAEQMAQIKKLYAGLGPDQPASEEIYVEAKLIAGQARRKSAQIAHNCEAGFLLHGRRDDADPFPRLQWTDGSRWETRHGTI